MSLLDLHYLSERHIERMRHEQYQTALICSVIANVNRQKNSKTYKPDDFMPRVKKVQTLEEQMNILKNIVSSYGGE